MSSGPSISTNDLEGANDTLSLLVNTLRQLREHGVNPELDVMVQAIIEDDDVWHALARCSLLLSLALQRLADTP